MSNTIISRKELYDLVWSTPMITLAKKYSITDYGLRKVCKSMNIPLPKPGYWERMKVGRPDDIEKLSESYSGVNEMTLSLRSDEEENTNALVKSTRVKSEDEIDLAFRIPERLTNPDKLIINTKECIEDEQSRRWDQPPKKKYHERLSISVAKENLSRALRFMDTFIKVMRNRGHTFIVENGTHVVINEEKVSLCLRELSKRIVIDDKNSSWQRTELVPTNKLIFIATFYFRTEVPFKDGRNPLEFQLENIVSKLEMKANEAKEYRLQNERSREEYREKERLRKEEENRRANELSEFRNLLLKSKRWKKAVDLRNYLDSYEANAIQSGSLTEDKIKWLTWARKEADWYDPEIEAVDELLMHVDRDDLNKHNSNSAIYNW